MPDHDETEFAPDSAGETEFADTPRSQTLTETLYSGAKVDPARLRRAEIDVPAEWQIGDVILDLYEVTSLLGEGGMGKVFKVRHKGWNIDLAVKTPKAEVIEKAGGAEQFTSEAETWVNLGLHPHTVSCYYVRQLGGIPRVFAEYVEGGSLADWIESRKLYEGGLEESLKRILDIAIQFAWGLHYTHEQGLIHRDVKPANVMLTPAGTVKVTDFGLSRATGGGTPQYYSPEQAQAEAQRSAGVESTQIPSLTAKTDMWSWALCVLEMFAGERIWEYGQMGSHSLTEYLREGTEDADTLRMPVAVASLLQDCFKRDPNLRPSDLLAVTSQLEEVYLELAGQAYPRELPKAADALADSLNNNAVSLLDLGKSEVALDIWRAALKEQPHHLEAAFNRGLILWRCAAQNDRELLDELDRLPVLSKDKWKINYARALVHLERNDAEAAAAEINEALLSHGEEIDLRKLQALAEDSIADSKRHDIRLNGPNAVVNSISFAPAGHLAATGHADNAIRVWDAHNGEYLQTMLAAGAIKSLRWNSTGRFLASGDVLGSLKLWQPDMHHASVVNSMDQRQTPQIVSTSNGTIIATAQSHDVIQIEQVGSGESVLVVDGFYQPTYDIDTHLPIPFTLPDLPKQYNGHTARINAIAIGADGHSLITASDDLSIKLWDLASATCVKTITGHACPPVWVGVSGSGEFIVSKGSDHRIKLWDSQTGNCIRTFGAGTEPPVFGQDCLDAGGVMSTAAYDEACSLRAKMDECVQSFDLELEGDSLCGFDLNDKKIALGHLDGAVEIRDLESGQSQHYLRGQTARIVSISFGPGGDLLASVSSDGSVNLWDVKSKTLEVRFREREKEIIATYFDSESKLRVLTGNRESMLLWDAQSHQLLREFAVRRSRGPSFVTANGHYLLTPKSESGLTSWEIATGRCLKTITSFFEEKRYFPLGLDLHDRVAWRDHDSQMRVGISAACGPVSPLLLSRVVGSEALLSSQQEFERLITRARLDFTAENFSAARRNVALARAMPAFERDEQAIEIWANLYSQLPRSSFRYLWPAQNISAFEPAPVDRARAQLEASPKLNPNGKSIVSCGIGGLLRVWDVQKARTVLEIDTGQDPIFFLKWVGRGRYIATGGAGGIRVWNAATGRLAQYLQGGLKKKDSFSSGWNENYLASSIFERRKVCRVTLWDIESGRRLREFNANLLTDQTGKIDLSPDGRFVILDQELWSLERGERIKAFGNYGNSYPLVDCPRFSHDGEFLIGYLNGRMTIWRIESGEICFEFGSIGAAFCITSDMRYLATGDNTGTCRLWDMRTGSCLHTTESYSRVIRSMSFSEDSRYLFVSTDYPAANVSPLWLLDWDLEDSDVAAAWPG